jgi:hypothetical protein
MKIKEILDERVINLHKEDNKDKYGEDVWNILQKSYESIGGFKTAANLDELKEKSGMWKIVKRGDDITAVRIYKDQFGRKGIAMGSDGTTKGKKDTLMLCKDDIKFGRAWAETSGAPERLMFKFGAKPIPAYFAPYLVKKHILSVEDDGYHYTRLIDGHPHVKIIMGNATITPAEKTELEKNGVDFTNWPI